MTISLPNLAIAGLFVLLILVANIALLLRARSLAQIAQSLYDAQRPAVGVRFPGLHGVTPTGQRFDFEPQSVPFKTLVLVLSFTCKPCEDNWPNWEKLETANGKGMTLFIDLPGDAPPAYFAYHHLKDGFTLKRLDPGTLLALNIRTTPATFIIDKRGNILASWAGALTKDDETEAIKYLASD